MTIPFQPPTRRAVIDIQEDRCRTILWVVWYGWSGVLAGGMVDATSGEVAITERLRDEMRLVVPDKDIWIWPGAESRSSHDVLEPDGRTDIPIAFTSIREELDEQDAHAIIECKRVRAGDSALCRAYVAEGVQRFLRGAGPDPGWPKYAANHAFGFMAAYLLSGNTADAVATINGYLPTAERLGPSTVVREEWARASTHRRRTPLGPIVLNHAFLPFPAGTP